MIITLIGLGLVIIGIILKIIYSNAKFKSFETRNTIDSIQFIASFIGSIVTVICITVIVLNTICHDIDYQNRLYEKEIIEYRIERIEENITGNEMLYNDIVKFNNELRNIKKWANNPWTSWFNNQDIATIDYIEISDN